jgi:hypothetical protein
MQVPIAVRSKLSFHSGPELAYDRPLRTQQRAEGLHILQNRSTHKAVLAI